MQLYFEMSLVKRIVDVSLPAAAAPYRPRAPPYPGTNTRPPHNYRHCRNHQTSPIEINTNNQLNVRYFILLVTRVCKDAFFIESSNTKYFRVSSDFERVLAVCNILWLVVLNSLLGFDLN